MEMCKRRCAQTWANRYCFQLWETTRGTYNIGNLSRWLTRRSLRSASAVARSSGVELFSLAARWAKAIDIQSRTPSHVAESDRISSKHPWAICCFCCKFFETWNTQWKYSATQFNILNLTRQWLAGGGTLAHTVWWAFEQQIAPHWAQLILNQILLNYKETVDKNHSVCHMYLLPLCIDEGPAVGDGFDGSWVAVLKDLVRQSTDIREPFMLHDHFVFKWL